MKGYLKAVLAVTLLMAATVIESAELPDSDSKVARTLEDMQLQLGEEQTSLSNFTLNGFKAIDESNLIVSSGRQDQYLLTLAGPCLELPYALGIAFERRSTNISNFDSIVVNSRNRGQETCRISRIFQLMSSGDGESE